MDAQATEVLFGFFADLPDPRRHNVRHLFSDILAIAILAVMCRSDDWSEIVLYANAWKPWLATFLSLPNGIPCEDTFRRVFARINPDAFEQCFIRWTTALAEANASSAHSIRTTCSNDYSNKTTCGSPAWASCPWPWYSGQESKSAAIFSAYARKNASLLLVRPEYRSESRGAAIMGGMSIPRKCRRNRHALRKGLQG